MSESAIEKAVRVAGGQSSLARQIPVSPQAVQQWVATGKVPAERVRIISKITGVSPADLRPDIFGDTA